MRTLRAGLYVVVTLLVVTAASYGIHKATNPTFSSRRAPGGTPVSPSRTSRTTRPATTTTTRPHPAGDLSWQPVGQQINGRFALQQAILGGTLAAPTRAAVWMDRSLVRYQLVPGRQLPGGVGWNPVGAVPAAEQPFLVAAFNGGFLFKDSRGGFYAQGRTAYPLVPGAASLVIHADGTATVGVWGRDVNLDPTVAAVRQNLVLLVDHGAITAEAPKRYPYWGLTPHQSQLVWRSALGVDAAGNLVWVGGADMDPSTLAGLLVQAGCIRAMQMDINQVFVSFNTYQQSRGAVQGAKLLPGASHTGNRYLTLDNRDFVAVYRRG